MTHRMPRMSLPGVLQTGKGGPGVSNRSTASSNMTRTSKGTSSRRTQGVARFMDDRLNKEQLMQLKSAFERADIEQRGSLNIGEFCKAFGKVFDTKDLSQIQLRRLFNKVDANADGTVDFDEFVHFILLESLSSAEMRDAVTSGQFSELTQRAAPVHWHKDSVTKILVCPFTRNKYITTSRDGCLKIWKGRHLPVCIAHTKVSTSWLTDVCVTPITRRIAVSSMDRRIYLFDIMSSTSLELREMLQMDGIPLSMDTHRNTQGQEVLLAGDDGGNLNIFKSVVLIKSKGIKRVLQSKVQVHKQEWITKVQCITHIGAVVTCSLDGTLKVLDLEQPKVQKKTLVGHSKGVYSFGYSSGHNVIVSCGIERQILIWNPYTGKQIGSIITPAPNHTIVVNNAHSQIIAIGADRVVNVYDIGTHKRVQMFEDNSMVHNRDHGMAVMALDETFGVMLTAGGGLQTRQMRGSSKLVIAGRSEAVAGSKGIVQVVFNSQFDEVVTCDGSSNVHVWDLASGQLSFKFNANTQASHVTTMAFDRKGRRLITGHQDGAVFMWNFGNGACLRTLKGFGSSEVSCIVICRFFRGAPRVVAAGWNGKQASWPEDGGTAIADVSEIFEGHDDDVLSIEDCGADCLISSDYSGLILCHGHGRVRRFATRGTGIPVLSLHHWDPGFVVGVGETELFVWRLSDGEIVHSQSLECSSSESVRCANMCLERALLFTGDTAGCIKTWALTAAETNGGGTETNATNGNAIGDLTLKHHFLAHPESCVTSLSFASNDHALVSGAKDGRTCLWTIQGILIGVFNQTEWHLGQYDTYMSTQFQPPPSVRLPPPSQFRDDGGSDGVGEDKGTPSGLGDTDSRWREDFVARFTDVGWRKKTTRNYERTPDCG